MIEDTVNQLIFVVFLGASLVPFYLTSRFGRTPYGMLSALLGLFLIFHWLYHLSESFGIDFFSDIILEPISATFVFGFAVYLYRKSA